MTKVIAWIILAVFNGVIALIGFIDAADCIRNDRGWHGSAIMALFFFVFMCIWIHSAIQENHEWQKWKEDE